MRRTRFFIIALFTLPVLFACSLGGGTSTVIGGITASPTPTPCATHATATAIGWTQNKQIFGAINGAAPAQLTNFTYPIGLPNDTGATFEAPTLQGWAPDGHHFALVVTVVPAYPGGPAPLFAYPYVVDATTHVATRIIVPSGSPANQTFQLAWADNHSLLIIPRVSYAESGGNLARTATTATYRYDVTTALSTALPGVTNAFNGLVRCGTYYYLDIPNLAGLGTASYGGVIFRGTASVVRYDLASSSVIGSPIAIGDAQASEGSELGPYPDVPGWDVTQDNSRLVYQRMTVTGPTTTYPNGHIATHFIAAGVDGSSPTGILSGGGAQNGVDLTISPNGLQVAVTNANPTPNIFSGAIAGSSLRAYAPDAFNKPAWLPDSSGFDSNAGDLGIEQYLLSTPPGALGRVPGTSVVATGRDPVSLP